MEFKSLKFPLHTEKSTDYLNRVEPGVISSRKQMNRPMIDFYSYTEEEKEELKKAQIIGKQFLYFAIIRDKNPICLYCHSEIVYPSFCPKCNYAVQNGKCNYCGKDISDLPIEYVFCRECLQFIDEEQFKKAYKDKIKEIEQRGHKPPEVFFQICLEKCCKCSIDYKSNFWFCEKHWEEYRQIREGVDKGKDIDFSRTEKEREKIREEYYERVNPKWIWRDYYGPALELAKKGNYKAGQKILINFLKVCKDIPEYSSLAGYEILGDLCFFDEDYERAISYYKYKNWNLEKVLNRVLNARRLSGKPMTGDEIIEASLRSFHVDESIKDKNNPLAGYTKGYSLTGFTKNNKDVVGEFAEELVIKWEREHKKRLLGFGTKMSYYIWGNLYTAYLNKLGKDGDSEWYEKKFLEKSYNYYCPKREFVEVVVQIVYDAENAARQYMGVPKRGEGWVSETALYYKVKQWFSDYEVIHHSYPLWLDPQHLDIHIPELKLAVEYQGTQHFRPIDFFGGETAFKMRQGNDKRKKELCEKNAVRLIYVVEEDDKGKILEKLRPYLKENVKN